MMRRYKTVERMLHLWVFRKEHPEEIAHALEDMSTSVPESKPFQPPIPLHAPDLYLDGELIKAS